MNVQQNQPRRLTSVSWVAWLLLLVCASRCSKPREALAPPETTLRVGVGQVALTNAPAGLRQLVSNLTLEWLVNFNEDGRARPWLAERWETSPDGLVLKVKLRPGIKFHDGTALRAQMVAETLRATLPRSMGPIFEDVASITAEDDTTVAITAKRPSPLILEALEANIAKPGAPQVGTGPFMPLQTEQAKTETTTMVANRDYYLGPPAIGKITINTYPNVRAAWAELLRDRLDMLYEVGIDALDSLESSTKVAVYTFPRPYQYMLILNTHSPTLESRQIRRALNLAIDRRSIVNDGLNGHGTLSIGPVSPLHWALPKDAPGFNYDPATAASIIKAAAPTSRSAAGVKLTCLIPTEFPYDRLALLVKRQFEAVGIDLSVEQVSADRIGEAFAKRTFEAVLIDTVTGPTLFRPYEWWHSRGTKNMTGFASPVVDAALDEIRHAKNDDEFRAGVAAFQKAVLEDPPAVFLAWSERARAVSRRFDVPVEKGRDILGSLRLWKPVNAETVASRN